MALTALSRINEVPDVTDVERRELMGRCYFLVGYYYYLLMLQYGPVPIVPETPFNVDVPVAEMSLEREHMMNAYWKSVNGCLWPFSSCHWK